MTDEEKLVFVCFEGVARPEQEERGGLFYSAMQGLVKEQDGFVSETAFASTTQAGGDVLYVKFDNERHVREWRRQPNHLKIQALARDQIYTDYRLRIGRSVQNTAHDEHESVRTSKRGYLLVWKTPIAKSGSSDSLLDGIKWQGHIDMTTYINPTHVLHTTSWTDLEAAIQMKDSLPRTEDDEVQLIAVQREYGKYKREDAPKDADESQRLALSDESISVPEV